MQATSSQANTIHASAVLAGAKAVLIRGPSGSGKSRLVLALLRAAQTGQLPFARLVADDRALLESRNGRLLVRPAPALAGLLEVRGLGIQRMAYEPVAAVGLAVTLAAPAAERLPGPETAMIDIEGVQMPHLAVGTGQDPLPAVLARLWL